MGIKAIQHKLIPPQQSPIPQAWIDDAIKLYNDPCWCQALFLGLSHFIAHDKLVPFISKVMEPEKMMKALEATKRDISQATWGNTADLTYPKTGKMAAGVYKACKTQKDGDCIYLNPDLLVAMGEVLEFSKIKVRYLTLPHEGLHKLFRQLQLMRGPLSNIDEEILVRDIIAVFCNVNGLFSATLSRVSADYRALLRACAKFGPCASSAGILGDSNMAPSVIKPVDVPATSFPRVDFNNDGVPDFVKVMWSPEHPMQDIGKDFRTRPHLWPDVVPHLQSQSASSFVWLHPYKKCPIPKSSQHPLTIWRFDRNDFWSWDFSFTRFFNSDRSMFFVPNQRVEWLAGAAAKRGIIDGLVVMLNPQTATQEGVTYAVLEKCRVVALDNLRWVTSDGLAIDMRHALKLGMSVAGHISPLSKSPESQITQVIHEAFLAYTAMGLVVTPEAKRDRVVDILKKSSWFGKLPTGWEASVLFALNLPRVPPAEDTLKANDHSSQCGPVSLNNQR